MARKLSLDYLSLLLGVLMLYCTLDLAVCNDCGAKNENITKCIDPLKDFHKLEFQDIEDFEKHCSDLTKLKTSLTMYKCRLTDSVKKDPMNFDLTKVKTCLTMHNCQPENSRTLIEKYQGTRDSLVYMCEKEDKTEYALAVTCIENTEVKKNLSLCDKPDQSTENKCKGLDSYISCITEAAETFCGGGAARVLKLFNLKRYQPEASLSLCTLDESLPSSAPPTLARPGLLSSVLLSLLLIVSVAMC